MEIKPFIDYKKYKWFFTSSGKLVVGGKSSAQNDELLRKLKPMRKDWIIMHTKSPGSPFAVIIEDREKVSELDLEETAIFTASFSRQWKEMKDKAVVDVFSLLQLYKTTSMSVGTWGVKGKKESKSVELKLVLTIQENKLRAVPEQTVKNKKDILLKIIPGNTDKKEMLTKLQVELPSSFSEDEILAALPAGGVSISRTSPFLESVRTEKSTKTRSKKRKRR